MERLSLAATSAAARVERHARRSRRLRLAVPGLRGSPALAARVEAELSDPELGVEEVRADARSGRVLVRYVPEAPLLQRLEPARDAAPGRRRPGRRGRRGSQRPEACWHALALDEVLERLETSRQGLQPEVAAARLSAWGPNAVDGVGPRSRLELLVSQIGNVPAMLLLGSAGLAASLRDFLDAGAIAAAVGLDVGIGYRIERQNEKLVASWRALEAGEARVIRAGRIQKVAATTLVPGDVVVIRAGDTVPADARVLAPHRLGCNEAVLTGESEPRAKRVAPVDEDALLAERTSMVYAGTTVTAGRARCVVTGIGPDTEAARIRELIEAEESPQTPFERRFERLGTQLSLAGAASGAAAAGIGLLRLRSPRQVVGNAVALAVAAIPEGLPVVSTSALLRSMQHLRERGVVVRRLVSAETLGGVSVVCADKTGTITLNDMKLEVLDVGRGVLEAEGLRIEPEKLFQDPRALILAAAVLNCDVTVEGERGGLSISGSPTEKALVRAADAAGFDRDALREAFPRRVLRERSDRAQYVISLHDAPDGGRLAFVKGAPEQVVELCDRDHEGPIDAAARSRLAERNHAVAAEGLRVLAVGWRRVDGDEVPTRGFTLLGLLGLRDPLRPGAAHTIQSAARAGIRTVILTGDQTRSAEAAARAVGLHGEVLEGRELAALLEADGREALARLRHVAAVSRVTPAQKAAIVRGLREAGEIVAMAGDGVNDAPAIKAADVGIAIGRQASDVSREAADILLAQEDMRSIVDAIGEGRAVQDNLRRAVRFLLATNLSEVALTLGAAAVGAREPLNPIRLLWLNLLSDSLPAIALATEPADGDLLRRPPAPPDAPLIDPAEHGRLLRDGALITAGAGFAHLLFGPAASFSALTGAQLGYTFTCRAPGKPPDEAFMRLVGGSAALHVAAVALPPMRSLFRLSPGLSPIELGAFGVGFLVPWAFARAAHDPVIVRRGRPDRHASVTRSHPDDPIQEEDTP